jgi:hypothetical protein
MDRTLHYTSPTDPKQPAIAGQLSTGASGELVKYDHTTRQLPL